MNGVINGFYLCNDERNIEISNRMYERNVPSQPLQAQFSLRPVSTKYDMMSVVDRRAIPTVPIIREPVYNVATTFNPGNDEGPWGGYAAKINDESRMKNLFFANQVCPQSIYIPSSTSDLYHVNVEAFGPQPQQPYPELFNKPEFNSFNPNVHGIASNFFDNCTRQQIKDAPEDGCY